jgi:glucan 1,3-beta-glucosidase
LNAMAYRNVAGGQGGAGGRSESYDYSKEGGLAAAAGTTGAAGAGSSPLRKRGVAPPSQGWWSRKSSKTRKLLIAAVVLALLIIAIAVAVPVAIVKSNANKENAAKAANDGTEKGIPTSATPPTDWKTVAYGGNGSTVYLEDGSEFRYNNSFGSFSSLHSLSCF